MWVVTVRDDLWPLITFATFNTSSKLPKPDVLEVVIHPKLLPDDWASTGQYNHHWRSYATCEQWRAVGVSHGLS